MPNSVFQRVAQFDAANTQQQHSRKNNQGGHQSSGQGTPRVATKMNLMLPAGCSVMRMDDSDDGGKMSRDPSPSDPRSGAELENDDDIGLHCTDDLDNMYDGLDLVNQYGIEEAIRHCSSSGHSAPPVYKPPSSGRYMFDPSVSLNDGSWDEIVHDESTRSDSEPPNILGIAPPKTSLARKFAYAIIFLTLGVGIGLLVPRSTSTEVSFPSKKAKAKPYVGEQYMGGANTGNETLLVNVAKAHGLPTTMAKNFATGDACWMEGYGMDECCRGYRNCWGRGIDGIIYTFEACCPPEYY